jgi:hypothetical protein
VTITDRLCHKIDVGCRVTGKRMTSRAAAVNGRALLVDGRESVRHDAGDSDRGSQSTRRLCGNERGGESSDAPRFRIAGVVTGPGQRPKG